MEEFNTSLLREKFTIHDKDVTARDAKPVIALSNRMEVTLVSKLTGKKEEFSVRAQSMHLCTRMVARMMVSHSQGGPLLDRAAPFDWEAVWDTLVNDYEFAYNPARWVAVYTKGRLVFEKGSRHPLLDVIEKCAAVNSNGIYDEAVFMAEKAFKDLGKNVRIEHDANVALVVSVEGNYGRYAIILRGAERTTTFNFSARAKGKDKLNVAQCLGTAAAFLEGVQLAFMVGMNHEKIRLGIIERHSKEEKQTREAGRRLSRLATEISNLEDTFEVRYRPEKPEFHLIVVDAEAFARKVLVPPPPPKG